MLVTAFTVSELLREKQEGGGEVNSKIRVKITVILVCLN